MKKYFYLFLFVLSIIACRGTEDATGQIVINDDGTTSDGSVYSAIDDNNFYINGVKYTIDVKEDHSYALEDMVKRPIWVALNIALPFIISRHFDKMIQDSDGRWKCGPDFAVDKIDVAFTLAVCDAQFAFQQYFALAVGEKHYDDLAAERASNVRHQKKTLLAYRRLPDPFCSDDVDREYGYQGNTGSICSRLKRLCDDGLAQKIRQGESKGKYRKLQS